MVDLTLLLKHKIFVCFVERSLTTSLHIFEDTTPRCKEVSTDLQCSSERTCCAETSLEDRQCRLSASDRP